MSQVDKDKTTNDNSTPGEDLKQRGELIDDAERRLIQVRQFTFDLFRRVGMIRDIDLPNVCFDDVTFDQCIARLADRAEYPSVWDKPYVAEIKEFLKSVMTDDECKRYWDGEHLRWWEIAFGDEARVYAPWDKSRLAQARRLVLEMEPRAEEWMDKGIGNFSLPDCLSWFVGFLDCPNNHDEELKARINAFLASNITESDWAYYRYEINSDPLEFLDPPEDGYLDDIP